MVITISNEVIEAYLGRLAESGLYGFTPGDAARRLIEQQLQKLIKEEPHLFRNSDVRKKK